MTLPTQISKELLWRPVVIPRDKREHTAPFRFHPNFEIFFCLSLSYFTTLPFLLILPIVLAVSKPELFSSVRRGLTSSPWASSAPIELLICFSVHMWRILFKRSPESFQTSDMQILNRKQNFHYQIWEHVVTLVFIVGGLCQKLHYWNILSKVIICCWASILLHKSVMNGPWVGLNLRVLAHYDQNNWCKRRTIF